LLFLVAISSTLLAQKDDPQGIPIPKGKLTLAIDPGMHHSDMRSLFFRDGGKQVVTVGDDHTARLWDAEGDAPAKVIHLPGFRVPQGNPRHRTAALSKDGNQLAVAVQYADKGKEIPVVYVLSLPDGKITQVLRGHIQPVNSLAFTHDGKRLATSSVYYPDSTIRV
jgi:WD40 repeat protein